MAYSSIVKPEDYFNTLLYTGNGSSGRSVTGVGFQPDWVWIKDRTDANPNKLFDVVRGVSKSLKSNSSDSEASTEENGYVSAFNSDGFTLTEGSTSQNDVNKNSNNYASWNWLAGGSSTTNPSGGTITTTASVNTTAGFSVFTYTGNGSAAHIAHGLGVAPTLVIIKGRSNSDNWFIKHPSLASNEYIYLNSTGAKSSGSNVWSNTNPDSTKIYIGTDAGVNGSGVTYVCYAFAEKQGYSKFGSYVGNGSSDGTFVHTGFRPALVLTKKSSGSGTSWGLFDSKRQGAGAFNPTFGVTQPDTASAEFNTDRLDFLSNGFKFRYDWNFVNNSGNTYIYIAFAEHPFVANDSGTAVPVVAR